MAPQKQPEPLEETPEVVSHQSCPWCGKMHASSEHDIDWYFVCCGHTRIVWTHVGGQLELVAVSEDLNREE